MVDPGFLFEPEFIPGDFETRHNMLGLQLAVSLLIFAIWSQLWLFLAYPFGEHIRQK